MNKIAHLFLIALAIAIMTMLAAIAWSQPQPGKIKVTVLTKANEPLQGATIRLLGTKQGAIAKFGGIGQINAVMPGTYSVAVTCVGFEIDTIKNISVVSDSIRTFTVHLKERPITGSITIEPNYRKKNLTTTIDRSLVPPIPLQMNDTNRGGFTIRGSRSPNFQIEPEVGDIVSGGPRVAPISIFRTQVEPVDTTSRVYRAYYKK